MTPEMSSTQNNRFQIVIPTGKGTDLVNVEGTEDAHVRIESHRQIGTNIYVDVFDSMMEDLAETNLVSQTFPCSDGGADEATRFLQGHRFRVAVMIR
ncbi:MAG: hypothetical protein JRN20_13380 [Nitrososphaerota archaeon]|nr:hypothetical protein [Nitrososphaerota archaeon]